MLIPCTFKYSLHIPCHLDAPYFISTSIGQLRLQLLLRHLTMSLQAKLSRKVDNARKRNAKNVLMPSPEKEQCLSCGRYVVAGPMGLSRHLSSHPQCSFEYSGDPTLLDGGMMKEAQRNGEHRRGISTFHAGVSEVPPSLWNPEDNVDDFGTSTYSDVDDDHHGKLSSDVLDVTLNNDDESEHPEGMIGASSSDDSDLPLNRPNTFGDAWSKRDDDNGLNLATFSLEEEVQVDLLETLKRLRCPMIAYDELMKWAVRSCSRGHTFRDIPISSRKTVVDKLCDRVDFEGLTPILKQLYLPYSNCYVDVVYFSAHAVFNSFLTCVDLNRDENYIFHDPDNPNVNPFARPFGSVLGDINTGKSYLKTYDSLIKKPEDMLLPCVFAIDKTTCDIGGGGKLSLEPIVISYGLMKHDIRKTPAAMRVLGFINTSPVKARAFQPGELRPNTPLPIVGAPHVSEACYRLNEYHLQIDFILRESGYLALQESGLKWNLHYRGKSSPVHLHLYVPFVVGDTVGHDALCGHYQSRTSTVAQLCRACVCPTHKSGYSKARSYAKRTPHSVNQMVANRQFLSLKANSQQYLINAFDSVRFGAHNNRGIFGACPGEILHLILLGWFKNVLDSFFKQIGKGSESARRYDNLLLDINRRVGRQSDRLVPKTTVTKGFTSGANIPGHEYAGCIFIMLISLYTSHFSEIFKSSKTSKRRKRHVSDSASLNPSTHTPEVEVDMSLSNPDFIEDWKMFLSSLLEWHAWLKQSRISRLSVSRSGLAVSSLMRSLKFVAPRLSGAMGNTTIKTHLVLHMDEDILNFGVPEVMNSSYAESAHITISKDTARNTQKRQQTFTLQAAMRYVENLAIRKCASGISKMSPTPTTAMPNTHRLQGKRFSLEEDADGLIICKRNASKKKKGDDPSPGEYHLTSHVSTSLAKHVLPHLTPHILHCHTEYKSADGQIYRAHPCYHDKPWFDHALVKWHGYDNLFPARIHAFLNLCNVRTGSKVRLPHSNQEVTIPTPGFYAVIESYNEVLCDSEKSEDDLDDDEVGEDDDEEEENRSIFRKFELDLIPNTLHPILYLVHVDSIKRPTIAVPDAFGDCAHNDNGQSIPNTKYIFMMLPQAEWSQTWESFIHRKHREIVTKKTKVESDESGDEGFHRPERVVPPSPTSRKRGKAKSSVPKAASARHVTEANTGSGRSDLHPQSAISSHKRRRM
jgi:hypothetical protein